MKKALIFFLGLVCLVMPVWSTDIYSVIESAKTNSSQYLNIEESYKNSLNNYNIRKLSKTGSGVSVNVGKSTIIENSDFYIPVLDVSYVLPEFAEGLDISAKASVNGKNSVGRIDLEKGASVTLGTSVSYSKKFEFSDIEVSDISDLQSRVQMETNHEKSILQFENSVIQDVISIMQLKNQLASSEKAYEKSITSYENSKKLEEITEGSIADMNQQMTLEKTRVSLESSKNNLALKLEQFEHNYGIDFEDITTAEEPNLFLVEKEDGNSTVYLSYLSMLSAKSNLDTATGNLSRLSVGGAFNPSVTVNTGGSSSAALSASASVGYTSGKWTLNADMTAGYSNGKWVSPTVSFSGSWGKNQSSDMNLEALNYTYSQAQNSYNDALYSYKTSINSLQTNIDNHKIEVRQLDVQIEYHQRILEAKQQLFDLGLCTQTDFDNAQSDLDNDYFQKTILALQGILLLNQIKMIEL